MLFPKLCVSVVSSKDIHSAGDELMTKKQAYFHLHLVSDSTGETLSTVSRAAIARYDDVEAIEHIYPLVRSPHQLDRVVAEVSNAPGIVLYTLVDDDHAKRLESACREISAPCLNVLDPIYGIFQSYLNVKQTHRIGGQHALDTDYFQRIEALNYSMLHDDGQMPGDLNEADVVLVGISRTSKTPTCIYLANRGIKAANIPLVPSSPLPPALFEVSNPLIVGLVASAQRIQHVRQNRLLSHNALGHDDSYVDRKAISQEINHLRRLCAEHEWPLIDVTRRSIEETAAAIMAVLNDRRKTMPVSD